MQFIISEISNILHSNINSVESCHLSYFTHYSVKNSSSYRFLHDSTNGRRNISINIKFVFYLVNLVAVSAVFNKITDFFKKFCHVTISCCRTINRVCLIQGFLLFIVSLVNPFFSFIKHFVKLSLSISLSFFVRNFVNCTGSTFFDVINLSKCKISHISNSKNRLFFTFDINWSFSFVLKLYAHFSVCMIIKFTCLDCNCICTGHIYIFI